MSVSNNIHKLQVKNHQQPDKKKQQKKKQHNFT